MNAAQIMFQGEVVMATVVEERAGLVRFTVPRLAGAIVWTRAAFARATNEAYEATHG